MDVLIRTSQCACRGIRRCAVCKDRRFAERNRDLDSPSRTDEHSAGSSRATPSLKQSVTYNYCLDCNAAFLYEEELAEATNPVPGCGSHKDPLPLRRMLVWKDFITPEEEEQLIKQINQRVWVDSQSGRRKQDYGPKVNFKKRKLNLAAFTGLPDFSRALLNRMSQLTELRDFKCVELCNLEYIPERESCIDAHMDDVWLWGERLVTMNLASSTFLTLTPESWSGEVLPAVRVPMPRRSLFMMADDSRYKWKHAILPEDIREKRLAMTFRELSEQFLTGTDAADGNKIVETAYSFSGDVVR